MFSYFFQNNYSDEYEFTDADLNVIRILRPIYGNEYDFSKVRYKKHFKITLVCPQHGDFSSSLKILSLGSGCPQCNKRRTLNRISKHLNI
jgi:hypothetical protein